MDHMDEPVDFWEQRYASSDRVWSGHANATLVHVAQTLAPGRSLDLGCGEGGDVIWLAQQGWTATGVDISPSAIARARAAAESLGLSATATFDVADLEARLDGGPYDLVSACFLQSPVALSREQILRRAREQVAPGGRLLIVSHAAPPPWSEHLTHHHPEGMPQPADDLAALDLPPSHWEVEFAEVRRRAAVGPDGQAAELDDGVVLVRRLPGAAGE